MKLLVIADDLTGAIDSGVKFVSEGISVKVFVMYNSGIMKLLTQQMGKEIVVLCIPTRHLPREEAYKIIYAICDAAIKAGVKTILKKTDSALRGNLGAELSAVLDASDSRCVCFIPALPEMNRCTKEGIHFIDGVPLEKSVFGSDPFTPVVTSSVSDLLHVQCRAQVNVIGIGALKGLALKEGINVFDCTSQREMAEIVQTLASLGQLRYLAGNSGLAAALAFHWFGIKKQYGNSRSFKKIVFCGSLNPVSQEQMSYAQDKGAVHRKVRIQEFAGINSRKGSENIAGDIRRMSEKNEMVLVSVQAEKGIQTMTAEELEKMRAAVAGLYGSIFKALLDLGTSARLVVIGGDTLLGVLKHLGCQFVSPVEEVQPGAILIKAEYCSKEYEIIVKSGGFGDRSFLTRV